MKHWWLFSAARATPPLIDAWLIVMPVVFLFSATTTFLGMSIIWLGVSGWRLRWGGRVLTHVALTTGMLALMLTLTHLGLLDWLMSGLWRSWPNTILFALTWVMWAILGLQPTTMQHPQQGVA